MSFETEPIKLTILDARDCECYISGETVVLKFPEVVKRESDRICIRFLAAVLPLVEAIQRGEEPTGFTPAGDGTWLVQCPGAKCRLQVHVEVNADSGRTDRISSLESSNLMDELSRLPMFRAIDAQVVYSIAAKARMMKFRHGDPLVLKGEPGRYLYIILSGTAAVMGRHEDGTESVIAALKRGDSVGEMSLLTHENTSATVLAQDDCSAAQITRMEFINLLTRHPTFNLYYSKLLAARLRSTNQQFISHLEQGVTGKLSMVSLHEVIQVLKMNSRSGRLKVSRGTRSAELWFAKGEMRHVICGKQTGEDAFYDVATWVTGEFQFETGEIGPERTIHCDAMALILEAMRRQDEGNR